MKKHKNLLRFSTMMLQLGVLGVMFICFWDRVETQTYLIGILALAILFVWLINS